MPSRFSTPLRVGAVALGVIVVAAIALVVILGPEDGRWGIQGAVGVGPDASGSSSPSAVVSPTTADTAEPSPSASASMSLKEKNIAEAKERLVEYYATTAEVANDGYNDWERKLAHFWAKFAVKAAKGQVYEDARQNGIRTEGAAEVVLMEVRGYRPFKPGSEEVELEVCIDFSDVETFDTQGDLIPRDASIPLRYTFMYEMRNQGKGNDWAVLSEQPDRSQKC